MLLAPMELAAVGDALRYQDLFPVALRQAVPLVALVLVVVALLHAEVGLLGHKRLKE